MEIFFLISIMSGILTVLAPCILPFLPIVIGASETERSGGKQRISQRAIVVITALSVSVIIFTLILRATTLLIDIPQSFWTGFSGSIIIFVGLAIIFPSMWTKAPFVKKMSSASNRAVGIGYQKKSSWGDVLMGAALGPVFISCSPTYFFIIATVLPATFLAGFIYLMGFTVGLALSLLIIAYFGQRVVDAIIARIGRTILVKQTFGVIIILAGVTILTGFDKTFQAFVLDSGYGATVNLEEGLIERFNPIKHKSNTPENIINNKDVVISSSLKRAFPKTNWSKADPNIARALSGGPGKDGIPAIDAPVFESIDNFNHPDSVQAIVMKDGNNVKVYPYNILTLHEIVNDTVDDVPVAITFCPLCGSAIVFERTLSSGVTTFGVSGFLLESNMIMFDRTTETLWQQSTGKALAGEHFETELMLSSFQLMTIGEVKKKYPEAQVLSENTGHRRDYSRNPYVGYEESNNFFFSPSAEDSQYPSKMIFVAFQVDGTPVSVPWLSLKDGVKHMTTVNNKEITILKSDSELFITDVSGNQIPFYFEMWFSWSVQHGKEGIIFDPSASA